MKSTDTHFLNALTMLLGEIFDGPPGDEAFMFNPGDPGLLRQLESIDADSASVRPMQGKTTIASHVAHVRFALALLNRWADGEENPWADADWEASWKQMRVDEAQWRKLRDDLIHEAERWQKAVRNHAQWDDISAAGAVSSAAHTAYHIGAIRQILAAQQG